MLNMSPCDYSVSRCHCFYDECNCNEAAQREFNEMEQARNYLSEGSSDKIIPTYLMNANTKMTLHPNAHPARLNTPGKVRAPVPTMRLKMYVSPTYKCICEHISPSAFVYGFRL